MISGIQKLPATKTFPAGQDESRIAWVCDGGPTGGRWSCPKCVPKGGIPMDTLTSTKMWNIYVGYHGVPQEMNYEWIFIGWSQAGVFLWKLHVVLLVQLEGSHQHPPIVGVKLNTKCGRSWTISQQMNNIYIYILFSTNIYIYILRIHVYIYIYIYIWTICSHFSNVLLDELAGDDSTDAESERVWEAVACIVRLESRLFLFS